MEKRTPYRNIWRELSQEKSMIFLAGPRQSGKTTLSKLIAGSFTNHFYWNWDIGEHRESFFKNKNFFTNVVRKDASTPLIILDEIHKYKDWKNYLKGVYDQFHKDFKFLISGSGRLDIYQKGGDSMAGRYYLFHLFPFTMSELIGAKRQFADFLKDPLSLSMKDSKVREEIWRQLAMLSGFPEPFLSGRETSYRRWSNTYARQLVREDIRDLTDIKAVQEIETLYTLLPSKIGSPLSVTSLAENMKVSYNTIRSWLDILERFYLIFSIPTWTTKIARAIQKEKKYYLFDYARIKDDGARFENMVACELLRAVTLWNNLGLGDFSLHFIKDKEKREVDFLIVKDGKPFLLIEAKLSDTQLPKPLTAFQNKLCIPAVQLILDGKGFRMMPNGENKILVAPAWQWLAELPWH
ncbi:atpase [hydrocarbon metagenome]|uniref:Atpase n=1 Tax=hydrocarbon metagenome TaxID=938273 RepID=A0A0W8FTJ1_9ZZZZ